MGLLSKDKTVHIFAMKCVFCMKAAPKMYRFTGIVYQIIKCRGV